MSIYRFNPIFQERIWGGTKLAELYNRKLPAKKKIGESWELCDRPEACSELVTPVDGCKTLHDLWKNKKSQVFGTRAPKTERFPILIKLLEAADNLSVQVHPSEKMAAKHKAEPKSELWYFLHTEKGATIYAGLKKGATKAVFSKAIENGEVEKWLHQIDYEPGDALFLPSGRLHALGKGNVLLEIQQNSDTTYRVYDWKRKGSDGKPRELHVKEALESINFNDVEPFLTQPHGERILNCAWFYVERTFIFPGEYRNWQGDGSSFSYHFLAQGKLKAGKDEFKTGEAWLLSADHPAFEPEPGVEGAEIVTVQFPRP